MTHCNCTKSKVSLSNLVTYINNVVVVLLFLFLSLFDSIKEGIIFRINNTSKYIGGVGTVTVTLLLRYRYAVHFFFVPPPVKALVLSLLPFVSYSVAVAATALVRFLV